MNKLQKINKMNHCTAIKIMFFKKVSYPNSHVNNVTWKTSGYKITHVQQDFKFTSLTRKKYVYVCVCVCMCVCVSALEKLADDVFGCDVGGIYFYS
jgi:hypothetical protein